MTQKKLYIHTIGCQMNVYDSDQMAQFLESIGYDRTSDLVSADLILLNTCSIREKAEQKAFSFLGRLSEMKKRRPSLIIGMGGCVAQQEGEKVFRRMPFIDFVFGTHAISRLPYLVRQIEIKRRPLVDIALSDHVDKNDYNLMSHGPSKISAFVTIMRGCDNYCTYCIVPFVRGTESSRDPSDILKEIENLTRSGVREITLLGQNVNSYGKKEDLCSFPELLRRVDKVPNLSRIRFVTSHPKDLSDELIDAFSDLDTLCHHIHLPVQSGSNRILKRMNRKYTREIYLERVAALREKCPDIAITTDMIVGFPGETAADFEESLDLMKKVRFDSVFAFKYSNRPMAPAAKFKDKTTDEEKDRRLKTLFELQNGMTIEKNSALIGTEQWVLVEGPSKRDSSTHHQEKDDPSLSSGDSSKGIKQFSGRTTSYKIVNFTCEHSGISEKNIQAGTMAKVLIQDAFANSLRGRLIQIKSLFSDPKGDEVYAA